MSATAVVLAVASIAIGQGAACVVDVAPQPLDRALVATAAQLHVSFGGEVSACGRLLRGLHGRFTPAQAFSRLTRGSGCHIARSDGESWVAVATQRQQAPKPGGTALFSPAATPQDAGYPVAEVRVVAGRRAMELANYAGSSISMDTLELGSAAHRSLQDLTRATAELETTDLGPGRNKLFIRGLSDGAFSGSAASTVAIYLDDLPISYNAPDPDLSLADMERVEILAGPQGALFGAGAIGGVVRLVPRAPDLSSSQGAIHAGLSGVAHGGLGDDVEGMVNLPVLTDRLALRAVAYRDVQPGYIDDLGLGARDVNATERIGGRLAARLQISPGWSATTTVAYQDIDSASSQYVVQGDNGPPLSRTTRTPTPQDNDFGVASATLAGPLAFASLRLSAALVRHTATATYDATSAAPLFDAAAAGPAAFDETHRRQLAFGEAVLTSFPQGRAAWSAGVFVAHSTDDERERLAGGGAEPLLYREDRRDQLDEAALFGEAAYRLSPRLTIRVGLRVFRSTLAVRSREQQPVFGTRMQYEGGATTIDTSPKVQVELRVTNRLFAYTSFTTGYRPATLNTSAPPGTVFGSIGEVRSVRSDTARTYEVGGRWTVFGGARLSGAVFYTDWLGIQSDQFSAYGLPMAVNIGDGAVLGVQVEGVWPLPSGFAALGSLRLANQSLTADRNPAITTRADAGLPGVSPVSATLGLEWRRQLGSLLLSSAIRARYVGPSRLAFSAAPSGRMGDYVTDVVEASLARDHWSLTLAAENVTDGRANTFAFGDPFLPASVRQATPLRPRTLAVTVRRDF